MQFFALIFLVFISASPDAIVVARGGGADDRSVVYVGCSAEKFSADVPYQFNLDSLLSSLANSAGFSQYANFTSSFSTAVSPVYGLYQCRADISLSACDGCVSFAIGQLGSLCPSASSAAVQLHGCLVRYANESFVGRSGTELLYKKCGVAVANGGGDFVAMREAVFDMIKGGVGLYRLGSNGYVAGSAQCVGDQSAKQCTVCVNMAINDLKSYCNGAVVGEVYLDKCRAEFSSPDAYYSAPVYDRNTHARDAGKDIAIIIGIVAAVLFILLFLNYLKKSAEEKGKY